MVKVTLDLNVVLDVVLKRGAFLAAAEILSQCKDKIIDGYIPAHGIPTIYYILRSKLGREPALEAIDTVIDTLTVLPVDNGLLRKARSIPINDFEDAIVISSSEAIGCDYIITTNVKDFSRAAHNAISPEQFVALKE
jgi:hypothetical protein